MRNKETIEPNHPIRSASARGRMTLPAEQEKVQKMLRRRAEQRKRLIIQQYRGAKNMGFGLLFIGYFITFVMTMNNFKFIIAPLGYVVTMLALLRLGRFEPRFYFALICSLLLILFGAYGFLHGGADKLGIALPVWVSAAKPAVDWALFITEAALNITLLVSISALAEKVGLGRQQHGAKWRMIVVGGYYVLDTTRMLYFWNDAKANSFLVPVALLFKLLWIAQTSYSYIPAI